MNKQELIAAINETISANGQKGITAESLANILTEMVNAAPEGGSGGGSSSGSSNSETINISNYEVTEQGILISTTEEDAAHNAEVYAKYAAAVNSGSNLNLQIDLTKSIGINMFQLTDSDSMTISPLTVLYISDADTIAIVGMLMMLYPIEFEMTNDGNAACMIPFAE